MRNIEEASDLTVVNLITELQLHVSIKNRKELLPSILVNWSFDNIKYIDFLTKNNKLEDMASEETEEEIPKPKSIKTKKKDTAINRIPKENKLGEKEK
ncbi:hypothetical protein GLOIN_2v1792087 [Rhizophagus clarus]|uniref:Uncharacterized protein n=1 Tax=Rhizophagus clarus TaxID=94130 RepID=A0A8H3L3A8_9GLOM|nr:hypothetical protein GLOIN_2v1792087 [Rhizophagus clarus]